MASIGPSEPAAEDSTRPARRFFTFNPSLLLADLSNAALDVYADGMDALERKLVEDLAQAGYDMQGISTIQQGLSQLFEAGLANLDQAMLGFERLASVTSLAVPAELFAEPAPVVAATAVVDAEEEAALDAELEGLRAAAVQGRRQCILLRQQLKALDADLVEAGDASRFRPLADAVVTHKASILDDAAAISAASAKLQPLLRRAAALRAGGDKGSAGLPTAKEDAPAADAKARQHMHLAGASLGQLHALKEQLEPMAF